MAPSSVLFVGNSLPGTQYANSPVNCFCMDVGYDTDRRSYYSVVYYYCCRNTLSDDSFHVIMSHIEGGS